MTINDKVEWAHCGSKSHPKECACAQLRRFTAEIYDSAELALTRQNDSSGQPVPISTLQVDKAMYVCRCVLAEAKGTS